MRHLKLITIVISSLMPMLAWGQAPSTRPALPAGHPDISQMDSSTLPGTDQPAAPSGSLPAGHPDISQSIPTPNSTGAAGLAGVGRMNLPAGHPDLSQVPAPTTQPRVTGDLFIRALQATKDGPAVGRDEFVADLYIGTQVLEQIRGKLDENGRAQVTGIPLGLGPVPIVKIVHAGIEFQAAGQAFSPNMPTQELQVSVYESTEVAPAWNVRMQHVMVESAPGGLHVTEMLAVDNPGDRAWLGETKDGRRVTFTLALPANAKDVQLLSGLQDYSTFIDDKNELHNTLALSPGNTQYQVGYFVPAEQGTATIDVTAPGAVSNLMLFLPDDGTTVKATGLEYGGASDLGTGKRRFYRASNLTSGQKVSATVSGIVEAPAEASLAATQSTQAAQFIAGIGAAIILLFAVAFLFIRVNPKKART